MARNSPIGTIKDAALGTLRHPLGTTQKVLGQAVGVARGTAETLAHGISGLVPGRRSRPAEPGPDSEPLVEPEGARKVHGDPIAQKAAQAPARKAPARKAPAARKPVQKPAQKQARKPARKAAKAAPKPAPPSKTRATAAEVAAAEESEVTTPVGTTGADVATNPDTAETDLQQPGTEPLMDPGTVKAAASEAETLQKGADPDKG